MAANSIRRMALVGFMATVVLALIANAAWTWMSSEGRVKAEAGPDLPLLSMAPQFALTDASGNAFSSAQLESAVWVVDFFFTRCNGPCPTMSANMAQLVRHFKNAEKLRFVSISVDPENDVPEVLKAYAEQLGLDPRWSFLTGPAETIHHLAVDGFKLGSLSDPMTHSTRMVLVDQNRRIRGYYDGTDDDQVHHLARDIALLLDKESAQPSR